MNKKERQAILKMLLIREELSDKEFIYAIDFVKKELIKSSSTEKVLKHNFSTKKQSRSNVSLFLNGIKNEQPDKYQLLVEVYKYVKEARIFKTVADARSFGSMIGLKEVESQAKQEVIYNIFTALSGMSLEVIMQQVSKAELYSDGSDDSYQKLSDFLMNTDKR